MPKLIPEIRETLINEVRRLINNGDYSKVTIRTVSKNTNIAVGTVYNYFKSKDMLVASAVAEDWEKSLSDFKAWEEKDTLKRIEEIYSMLSLFIKSHDALFSDEEAKKKFSSIGGKWHIVLREQIACLIAPNGDAKDFLPLFIAESLLVWVMENVEYEKLKGIMTKLITEEI